MCCAPLSSIQPTFSSATKNLHPLPLKKHNTVFCVELNLFFDSTRDACKYLNLDASHSSEIRMSCRHGWKSHGYHWKYDIKGGGHDQC